MKHILFLFFLIAALVSCSTYTVRDEFDATTREYAKIVRWYNSEAVSGSAASSIRDEFEKREYNAKKVELLDYRVINVDYDEPNKKAMVNVEITYRMLSSNQVRTIVDKQMWVYMEEKGVKQWRITTLPPEFK